MITADTITDEQIRELREQARLAGSLVMLDCDAALPSDWIPEGVRIRARARCAEILNARSKERP